MRILVGIVGGVVIVVCVATAGVILSPAVGMPRAVVKNTSDSMPKGLYRLVPGKEVEVGDIVVMPDPPNHKAPWIMKWVVALPPSTYCWDEEKGTHLVDGDPAPKPVERADGHGPKPWKGCRRLEPGELVGYGETPTSYDSRYFGPVRFDDTWGVYKLVDGSERDEFRMARMEQCQKLARLGILERDFCRPVVPWRLKPEVFDTFKPSAPEGKPTAPNR